MKLGDYVQYVGEVPNDSGIELGELGVITDAGVVSDGFYVRFEGRTFDEYCLAEDLELYREE